MPPDEWSVPGQQAPAAPAPADGGGYLPESDFRNQMDRVYGAGNWTETGGWRSQARENQLRAQGAQTVRPGAVSAHSLGSQDAPGAHDIVVRGMSPQQAAAALRARTDLTFGELYPEGAAGGQGAHLHVGMQRGVTADEWGVWGGAGAARGPVPDEWSVPAKPAAAPAKPGVVEQVARAAGWEPAERLVGSAVGGAVEAAGQAMRGAGGLADFLGRAQAEQAIDFGVVPDTAANRAMPFQRAATSAAEPVSAAGRRIAPANRTGAESIAHGVGGFIPAVAAGFADPALAASFFGAQGYDQAYADAKAHGADDATAQRAGVENAAAQAGVSLIPGSKIAEAAGANVVGRMANAALHGAVVGGSMQAAANVVAQQNYDPHRPIMDQVPEAAASMAIAGGAMHGVGEAFGAGQRAFLRQEAPTAAQETSGEGEPPDVPPSGPPGMPDALSAATAYAKALETPLPGPTPAVVPKSELEPAPITLGPEFDLDTNQASAAAIPEAPPPPPPAPYEEARIAAGAPMEFMPQAISDVAEYRGAAPRDQSILSAIQSLGGVRTTDATGARYQSGPDIGDALQAKRRPGLVNNKSGLSPEMMAQALADRGWFGADPQDPSGAFERALNSEAANIPVRHPESEAGPQLARRDELEREFAAAGIQRTDTPQVAAAKLASYRDDQAKAAGPSMDTLRARADALGVPVSPDATHEELLGDVLEREAIQAEGLSGAEIDAYERILDEDLTPEEHEWLSSPERGPRGVAAAPEPAGAAGGRAAPEPGAPRQAATPGARPTGAGAVASPVPRGAQLAHVDPRAVLDAYDKGYFPFRDKLEEIEQALFDRKPFTIPVADFEAATKGQPFEAHLVANTKFEGRPEPKSRAVKKAQQRPEPAQQRRAPAQQEPSAAQQPTIGEPAPRPETKTPAEHNAARMAADEWARQFDFVTTFPPEIDRQGRSKATEGDTIEAIHAETQIAALQHLRTQRKIENYVAQDTDPATDQPIRTPKRRDALIQEARDEAEALTETLDTYEDHFGEAARRRFERHIRDIQAGEPEEGPPLETPPPAPTGGAGPRETAHEERVAAEKKPESTYGKSNTLFTEDAANAAREKLRRLLNPNQLNAGIDPELVHAGITLAGYHVEAGARSFGAFAKAMLDDLGESARPYLRMWYNAVRDYPAFDARGMTPHAEVSDEAIAHVRGSGPNLEPSGERAVPGLGHGPDALSAGPGGPDAGAEPAGAGHGAAGRGAGGGLGVPDRGAAPGGEWSVEPVRGGQPGVPGQLPERGEPLGGDGSGDAGVLANPIPAERLAAASDESAHLEPVSPAAHPDAASINAPPVSPEVEQALPTLFPEQRGDVQFALDRFEAPDGHGVLFTNGTGTGKTFTGGGIAKMFYDAGKRDILVVAPSQGILDAWRGAMEKLGVPFHVLESTEDKGKGPSGTTYANMAANRHLADREWDLIIPDESHHLSSDAQGSETSYLRTLRAISNHPDRLWQKAEHQLRDEVDRVEAMKPPKEGFEYSGSPTQLAWEAARRALDEKIKAKVEGFKSLPRSKVAFLSATPFAYDKNIDYAEKYLFNYGEAAGDRMRYNTGDAKDQFFMRHFGYRMRFNKLTKPESAVDSEVMERQFHEWLKAQKVLSGRVLSVDKDYDRKFVLVSDGIGNRIDQAMDFLRTADDGKFRPLAHAIDRKFDYLARARLLEAIKAKHAIAQIEGHQRLGRKVVVFHQYNEGGGFSPFGYEPEFERFASHGKDGRPISVEALHAEFMERNPYVGDLDAQMAGLGDPISQLTRAFNSALVYNGTISAGQRRAAIPLFNADGSGRDLIIVQADAGSAGISLHDVTGKQERVILNLGLPVRPTTAIQQEGRIYRIGQASNALFRYMNTGTNWERHGFATKVAERSGTAENLALGDQARTLRQSFIDAFLDSAPNPPARGEGVGGKALDRETAKAVTEFQKAKSYYFANQKQRGRRDQREGADYFATPEPLGLKMVEWADVRNGEKILEPSAGHGAIARFFPETTDRTLVEPSPQLASRAALSSPGARILEHRLEDLHAVNKYDAIVMNPPFGAGGATAIDHLRRAANHLRDGGRIVALIPEGPSADKRYDDFMDSDASKGLYEVASVRLPEATFERAGTKVRTRVVVLERQNDVKSGARPYSSGGADLSGAKDVGELFDRLEHLGFSERVKPGAHPPESAATPEAAPAAPRRAPAAGTLFDTAETKHGKTGADLYVATAKDRMESADYKAALDLAKKHGGYYSAFRGRGAIPGFQFPSDAQRSAFITEARGAGVAEGGAKFSRERGPLEGEQDMFGTGPSAVQAAAAREGALKPTKRQTEQPLGGLFGERDNSAELDFSQGPPPATRSEETPDLFAKMEPIEARPARGPFSEPAPDWAKIHFDQNHADLYRMGLADVRRTASREQLHAEAERLGQEMGRYMDWTDVPLSDADLARVDRGEAPSAEQMMRTARQYVKDAKEGEPPPLYDTDAYHDVVRRWYETGGGERPKFARQVPLYSALERNVDRLTQKQATPDQWLATLRNAPGVKKEELEWTGLEDWLKLYGKDQVPKEAVQAFIRDGGVRVEEQLLGEPGARPDPAKVEARAQEIYDAAVERHADHLVEERGMDEEAAREAARDFASWDEAHEAALEELTPEPDETHHEGWKLPGGTDYRELLFTLPGIADNFTHAHWGDTPGVMAHVRFDSREAPDGKKVLFIEEVQSDLHQQGRDEGYAKPATLAEIAKAKGQYEAARQKLQDHDERLIAAVNAYADEIGTPNSHRPWVAGYNTRIPDDSVRFAGKAMAAQRWFATNRAPRTREEQFSAAGRRPSLPEYDAQYAIEQREALALRRDEAQARYETARKGEGVPDAPFKTAWPALVMKRMIVWAAEHGFDRIAWTTGDEQVRRYHLAQHVGEVSVRKAPDGQNIDVRMSRDAVRVLEREGHYTHANSASSGQVRLSPDKVREIFGAELGQRMVDAAPAPHEPMHELGDQELEVGGSGQRAFYDRNLVNITNDLVKKYGAKVERSRVIAHAATGGKTARESIADWDRRIEDWRRTAGLPENAAPRDVLERRRAIETERRALVQEAETLRGGTGDPHERVQALERNVRAVGENMAADDAARRYYQAIEARAKAEAEQHSFELTDKMKEAAEQGLPLFQRATGPGSPTEGMERLTRGLRGSPTDFLDEAQHGDLIDAVNAEIKRLAPKAVVRPMRRMVSHGDSAAPKGYQTSGAQYRKGLKAVVAWSLEAPDPMRAGRHEALHALRDLDLFDKPEWKALEKAAVDRGWLDRYHIGERYPGVGYPLQLEEAIADRFSDWRKGVLDAAPLPAFVKALFQRIADTLSAVARAARRFAGAEASADDIMRMIESGEIGQREPVSKIGAAKPTAEDQGFGKRGALFSREPVEGEERRLGGTSLDHALGAAPDAVGRRIVGYMARILPMDLRDVAQNVHMGLNPMAVGGEREQANAKAFANALRAIEHNADRLDAWLERNFNREQRQRMGLALDRHGVAVRRGEDPGSAGLEGLTPKEREAVLKLNEYQDKAYEMARDVEIHDNEGLEYHFPRMAVKKGGQRITEATPRQSGAGGNLTVTTGQMRQRKYETFEDTEAAVKRAFGPDAYVSRDIRAVNLATRNLLRAWAGKKLVNEIDRIGKETNQEIVSSDPARGRDPEWFTMPHPALTNWTPRWQQTPDGKTVPLRDEHGNIVWHATPKYIRKTWEGPLKAVLNRPDPKAWRAVMTLKSKAVGAIMYNPLVHNQVIFGKAFPTMVKNWKWHALTLKPYRDGFQVRQDAQLMQRALTSGLVPINGNYLMADLGRIEGETPLEPGHGWTSAIVGEAAKMMNHAWEAPTKEAMDRFHDFVSNRMLWDQVANLQAGIWKATSDHYVKQGFDPDVADKIAAYFANQYAGSVPREAMSGLARGILNGVLFSRSFHATNIGGVKAIIAGLPTDVQAQIRLRHGDQVLAAAQGATRAQAAGAMMIDAVSAYAFRALAAAAVAALLGRAIQWPQDNEPGKTNKVLIGYEPNGTALYVNVPFGKYIDEIGEWNPFGGDPLGYAQRIMFGPTREVLQYFNNDIGFGRHAYNPYANTPGAVANNFFKFLGITAESVFPTGTFTALWNAAAAPDPNDRVTARAQLAGLATGFTISHGAPGGPGMGDIFHEHDRQQAELEDARPKLQDKWREAARAEQAGDLPKAAQLRKEVRDAYQKLGVSPGLAAYYNKVALNPALRMTKSKLREFREFATPQEKASFERHRAAGQQ